MESTPFVSIILPVYNRAATLPRAVESVLIQTFDDYELIIVDDGSQDDTASVARGYLQNAKVRYIHQDNAGAGAARNQGIAVARGQWVAFQDSDDEWCQEKLQAQVDLAKNSAAEVAVIYSDMVRVTQAGKRIPWLSPDVRMGVLIDADTLDYQVKNIGLQSALIRRSVLLREGKFDQHLPRFIDLDLFARLALRYRFAKVDRPLVTYYETRGISSDPEARARARIALIDKYRNFFERNARYLAHQYIRVATAYWMGGHMEEKDRYCRLALATYWRDGHVLAKAAVVNFFPRRLLPGRWCG